MGQIGSSRATGLAGTNRRSGGVGFCVCSSARKGLMSWASEGGRGVGGRTEWGGGWGAEWEEIGEVLAIYWGGGEGIRARGGAGGGESDVPKNSHLQEDEAQLNMWRRNPPQKGLEKKSIGWGDVWTHLLATPSKTGFIYTICHRSPLSGQRVLRVKGTILRPAECEEGVQRAFRRCQIQPAAELPRGLSECWTRQRHPLRRKKNYASERISSPSRNSSESLEGTVYGIGRCPGRACTRRRRRKEDCSDGTSIMRQIGGGHA